MTVPGAIRRPSADRLRAALGATSIGRREALPAVREPELPDALGALYSGRVIENGSGRCYAVEWAYPLAHRHGLVELGSAGAIGARAAACLARRSSVASAPLNPLFLDTETTGLSGGTGTYAFLVGLGFFESDRFVVRQLLMRDYDEEPALLEAVAGELVGRDAVVTFNGTTFDLPLIETRYLVARRSPPALPDLHLDLLYPARRLWRRVLEGCSLSVLERAILGHERHDDLPSWMVPSAYFQYVRSRDPRLIGSVLEHNLHDILSLAGLAGWMADAFERPTDRILDPRVLAGLASVYETIGWLEAAVTCLQNALGLCDTHDEIPHRLARLYRRMGMGDDATRMWRIAASDRGPRGLVALVALAKLLEHERRDFAAAQRVVEHALTRVQLEALGGCTCSGEISAPALEHRLARLRVRQRRAMEAPAGASQA